MQFCKVCNSCSTIPLKRKGIVLYELQTLCSDNTGSSQISKDKKHTSEFPWQNVLQEVKEHCSTLLTNLYSHKIQKKQCTHYMCNCLYALYISVVKHVLIPKINTLYWAYWNSGKYIDPF